LQETHAGRLHTELFADFLDWSVLHMVSPQGLEPIVMHSISSVAKETKIERKEMAKPTYYVPMVIRKDGHLSSMPLRVDVYEKHNEVCRFVPKDHK